MSGWPLPLKGMLTGAGLVLFCAVIFCGCGGTGSTTMAPDMQRATGQTASLIIAIDIPQQTSTTSHVRLPAFVSASTRSAKITLTPSTGAVQSQITNCTSAYTCSATFTAALGLATLQVSLYDQGNAVGNLLASGSLTTVVTEGSANKLSVTLNGVVDRIVISANASLQAATPTSLPITVTAYDPRNNIIIAPGSYIDSNGNALTIHLADSDLTGATTITPPTITAPGTSVKLNFNASASLSATLGATVTGGAIAGVVTGTTVAFTLPALAPSYNTCVTRNGTVPASTLPPESLYVKIENPGVGSAGSDPGEILRFALPITATSTAAETITDPNMPVGGGIGVDLSGHVYTGGYSDTIVSYVSGASGQTDAWLACAPAGLAISGAGLNPYMTFDSSNNLYVWDNNNGGDSEYWVPSATNGYTLFKSIQPLLQYSGGSPLNWQLAVDSTGRMTIGNYGCQGGSQRCIATFAPGWTSTSTPAAIFPYFYATYLTTDSANNLYMFTNNLSGGGSGVAVYAPLTNSPTATPTPVRTIRLSTGQYTFGGAVDSHGNVYSSYANGVGGGGTISIYSSSASGSATPSVVLPSSATLSGFIRAIAIK